MKALTLHQPWATLIALGVKKIETRSWRAPAGLIGQRIAVHAGKQWAPGWLRWHHEDSEKMYVLERSGARVSADAGGWYYYPDRQSLPLGAVVCTARLVECLPIHDRWDEPWPDVAIMDPAEGVLGTWRRHDGGWCADLIDQFPYGDFAPGRWGWILDEIEPVDPPVPARGRQGMWEWEEQ